MTYKCTECGHIFEDGEQTISAERHGFDDGFEEYFASCPICGGEFEAAKVCKGCDKFALEDELFDGWCDECLKDAITYDVFRKYAKENDLLTEFVLCHFFDMKLPKDCTAEFHEKMEEFFDNEVKLAESYPHTSASYALGFLDSCKSFLLDGEIGARYEFAEWLNAELKGVK